MGWIRSAWAINRGCSTFITASQPAAMTMSTPGVASGFVARATSTGGAHARNGPKNGIAISRPDAEAVAAA